MTKPFLPFYISIYLYCTVYKCKKCKIGFSQVCFLFHSSTPQSSNVYLESSATSNPLYQALVQVSSSPGCSQSAKKSEIQGIFTVLYFSAFKGSYSGRLVCNFFFRTAHFPHILTRCLVILHYGVLQATSRTQSWILPLNHQFFFQRKENFIIKSNGQNQCL